MNVEALSHASGKKWLESKLQKAWYEKYDYIR